MLRYYFKTYAFSLNPGWGGCFGRDVDVKSLASSFARHSEFTCATRKSAFWGEGANATNRHTYIVKRHSIQLTHSESITLGPAVSVGHLRLMDAART